MLAELAVFALILALVCCLLQGSLLLEGRTREFIEPLTSTLAALSALLVFGAFVALILLRLDSDFTVINVAEHSNRALPLLYKIAGTWGNHEGSMLLWLLVLVGHGAWLARTRDAHNALFRDASAIQALLSAGVLIFILATSNPFARIFPPPLEGKMLNPLLQDMALALHPPLLYLGYVGFSSVFSLAVAGLRLGSINRGWAAMVHPWIVGAWTPLAIGIALGSWWAYRELGWGGYWFWDPVENASLMPWLAGTALLHSNIVLKKRGIFSRWAALLAILTFGLSLVGTFLVRSGAITSVHSFASDPTRGLYILAYLAAAIGSGLWIYSTRSPDAPPSHIMPISREGGIALQNLLILTACATILFGTIYPMLVEALTGQLISVGAPYFNATFLPIMGIGLLFAAFAPALSWQHGKLSSIRRRLWPAWSACAVVVAIVFAIIKQEIVLAFLGLGLAALLMASNIWWLSSGKWRKLAGWPVFLAHSGAAVIVIGITGLGLWSQQNENMAAAGDDIAIAGYILHVGDTETEKNANYEATRLSLQLLQSGQEITTLTPEFRRYALRGATTSEAAIYTTPAYDLYTVIGETNAEGKTALRIYYRPTVSCLWLGALMIAAAGIISGISACRRRLI